MPVSRFTRRTGLPANSITREEIETALNQCGRCPTKTAALLGLGVPTLFLQMSRLGLRARNRKITVEQAAVIRSDGRKHAVIAAEYGITRAYVSLLKTDSSLLKQRASEGIDKARVVQWPVCSAVRKDRHYRPTWSDDGARS